ncbi:hypothetical protein ASF22_08165 [Methylobacterium sp. Leaf87]|uniref:DUF938 domain-containing protein n=1 Tax=Methylobacterium sp. Leaf87 TaxID=1736243 RepID=UPI0006FC7BAB|nr:DUF938 domain-containing protein [Methylobacterium sp. Leaf87]KQO59601.1 hypothetical protein ASF22_08165 [Methylobacterium sp. Leaf87]
MLIASADAALAKGSILHLYGPFREHGAHTAPSNATFDDRLRARKASWGIHNLEAAVTAGRAHQPHLAERVAMPANNLSLIFHKACRYAATGSEALP